MTTGAELGPTLGSRDAQNEASGVIPVATHDLGTDVAGEVAGEVVVEPARPPGSVRLGQLALAPAHDISADGSACPKGRSKDWPGPAPYPSIEMTKF